MIVKELQDFHDRVKSLKYEIGKEQRSAISKRALRTEAERIATDWFQSKTPSLTHEPAISAETIEKYSSRFARLLKLSRPNNLKSSYVKTLAEILRSFRDDLIGPIQMQPKLTQDVSLLAKIFVDLESAENQYMKEAISCASHGLRRGAAVLGWCAAIDRIHRSLEAFGFNKFNAASVSMKTATAGRFKRFNKVIEVQTIGELREVFDTDILWILEGMQLIDSNQYTRLRACFELRCQCAHPGEAPVTEYNLLSFFSDLSEIVFKNPKFSDNQSKQNG